MDATERVIATAATSDRHSSARMGLSDRQADVAWASGGGPRDRQVVHHRFAVSRPFVRNVATSPSSFQPLLGETTISYSLADDVSPILTVTVKAYTSANVLVRTLVNGSQSVGNQSVVWDGKNDAGVVHPAGMYTVKVNPSDGEGLAARRGARRSRSRCRACSTSTTACIG